MHFKIRHFQFREGRAFGYKTFGAEFQHFSCITRMIIDGKTNDLYGRRLFQ